MKNSGQAELYNLRSGRLFAWAHGTAARCAAIQQTLLYLNGFLCAYYVLIMCLFHFHMAIRPLWPQSWLLNLSLSLSEFDIYCLIPNSHRRQDKTRLSCQFRRWEQNSRLEWTVSKFGDRKFWQCFVQFRILFTTSHRRQDKTVLTCRQFCSPRRHGQDKTRRSCLVCVDGVN